MNKSILQSGLRWDYEVPTKNNYVTGPESPGCFNTGTPPALVNKNKKWYIFERNIDCYKFGGVNGIWMYFLDNPTARVIPPGKVNTGLGKNRYRIWRKTSRKSAIAHFEKLCRVRLDSQRQDIDEIEKAKKDIKSNDLNKSTRAAFVLSDYGMI